MRQRSVHLHIILFFFLRYIHVIQLTLELARSHFSLFLYELAYLLTTPVQNQGGGTTQVLLKHRSDDDRPFIVLAETKPRLCAQCIILAVSRAYGMCFSHVPSNVVCGGFLSEIQCTENQRFFFDKMQKKTRCVCGGPLTGTVHL